MLFPNKKLIFLSCLENLSKSVSVNTRKLVFKERRSGERYVMQLWYGYIINGPVRVVRNLCGKGASRSGWQDPTLAKATSVLCPAAIPIDYRLQQKVRVGTGRPPSPTHSGKLKCSGPGLQPASCFKGDVSANPHC